MNFVLQKTASQKTMKRRSFVCLPFNDRTIQYTTTSLSKIRTQNKVSAKHFLKDFEKIKSYTHIFSVSRCNICRPKLTCFGGKIIINEEQVKINVERSYFCLKFSQTLTTTQFTNSSTAPIKKGNSKYKSQLRIN